MYNNNFIAKFNQFKQGFKGNAKQQMLDYIQRNPQSKSQIASMIRSGKLQQMGISQQDIQDIQNSIG